MQDLKKIVRPFYEVLLTAGSESKIQDTISSLLADSFQNINTDHIYNKTDFRTHVPGLFHMIPNMKCDIQEMIQEGNKVVVRSMISGNPVGDFFGISVDGTKSFNVMAIDIHTLENNQIVSVYHLEEWTTAFKQLQF